MSGNMFLFHPRHYHLLFLFCVEVYCCSQSFSNEDSYLNVLGSVKLLEAVQTQNFV